MFSLWRKIGTGATARRRPARECKVGVESLDTRAVPALIFPSPGSPLVESGTAPTSLNVAWDEHGHAFASLTTVNPFTPTAPPTTTVTALPTNLNAVGAPTPVFGVTGGAAAGTTNPLTLAYRLPVPVQDGDVVVLDFQTHQVSDLIRFQTASDPVTGTSSWMLIYSDVPTGTDVTETTTPPDPADVGIPAFTVGTTGQLPLLTQTTLEFGVQGLDVVEYAAEQATYSGMSDSPRPFGAP